ncbi:hypothetical protein OUZ56_011666 [Daphnia magna]|uniref:Uncharacterized protein n=1 Tax=Daphnia magna TaxID=35525 RepID=A0ABQ9Z0S6_9CRUS|nr:hypothetical protein OUZ56_011666 [Daphnia magna]
MDVMDNLKCLVAMFTFSVTRVARSASIGLIHGVGRDQRKKLIKELRYETRTQVGRDQRKKLIKEFFWFCQVCGKNTKKNTQNDEDEREAEKRESSKVADELRSVGRVVLIDLKIEID